jgi:katanin p80 WD40 repeat-containing subunit B1
LSTEKVLRTLTGHRSSIAAVDFHPYGDFFASVSADTNLKIWDIRKKGCIQTYKGQTTPLVTVQHSPDGRWVVSGDADGVVRVWDITAGRLLAKLSQASTQADGTPTKAATSSIDASTAPVTCLAFHPNEFLLATGTRRRVAFWFVESNLNSLDIRLLCFAPTTLS